MVRSKSKASLGAEKTSSAEVINKLHGLLKSRYQIEAGTSTQFDQAS
jgi:hypothetical protein